jgi:hypothetical protein
MLFWSAGLATCGQKLDNAGNVKLDGNHFTLCFGRIWQCMISRADVEKDEGERLKVCAGKEKG